MRAKRTVIQLFLSLCFAVLFVIASNVDIQHLAPLSSRPVSLTTLAVMLAGTFLGATYGFLTLFIVVFLTALGLPLIGQQGGLSLLLGAQGGFLWMYPVCAALLGFATSRIRGRDAASFGLLLLAAFGLGSLLRYAVGIPWYAHVQHLTISQALQAACYPYLPGDLLKSLVVAGVAWPFRPAGGTKRRGRK